YIVTASLIPRDHHRNTLRNPPTPRHPRSTLFPYTTLFRSTRRQGHRRRRILPRSGSVIRRHRVGRVVVHPHHHIRRGRSRLHVASGSAHVCTPVTVAPTMLPCVGKRAINPSRTIGRDHWSA